VIVGARADGHKELLGMSLGYRESTDSWADVLRDLRERGLGAPLLAVGDGGLGLWAALREVYPTTRHQRCWNHRLRNVLAKLPKRPGLHARVRAAYWAALHGAATPAEAEAGLRGLVGELSREYPSAAACLADDVAALTVHLAYPLRLRGGCARRTCWSGRWRRSGDGPR
jgi:transposase-like protein